MYIIGGMMLVSGAFGWALCKAAANGDAGRRYVEEHPSAAHDAEPEEPRRDVDDSPVDDIEGWDVVRDVSTPNAASPQVLAEFLGHYDFALPGETAEQVLSRWRATRPLSEPELAVRDEEAAHEAEETAWDLAAEHCSCRDCKARGSLQCDECSPPEPEDAP